MDRELTSVFYGAIWCTVHEDIGHLSYVWQIFERYLLHCFTAFIKCSIKFSKGMNNIVKDFNYSRKLCNDVNLNLKLNTVFSNFRVYLLKESTSSRKDVTYDVTMSRDMAIFGKSPCQKVVKLHLYCHNF